MAQPYDLQLIAGRGFTLRIDHHVDATVVRLEGELDMAGAESCRQQVLAGMNGRPVVVDLRDLRFLDSMGLSVLLDLARTSPRPVRFVRGPRSVQRVFQITGTEARVDWLDPEALPRV